MGTARTAGALALAVSAGLSSASHAASLIWDADGVFNNGNLGGDGTWDTTSPLWSNAVADQAWTTNSVIGDTAVFSGTAGEVTLAADINALGLQFTTAGYTVSGSQLLSLGFGGINASGLASGTTTINSNLSLQGAQAWLLGSGATLTVGGTVNRSIGSTINFSGTGTFNGAGLLAAVGTTVNGWATINGTADFAVSNGSQIVAATYTLVTGSQTGAGAAALDWKTSGNTVLTTSATINSLNQQNDFTVNSGVTLTLASGGLILGSTERWLLGTGGTIKSGLATGELYIHANAPTFTNGFQIQPMIVDGLVATAVYKDGAGQVELGNGNSTYSGGFYLNGGTVYLGSSSTLAAGVVTKGPLGTGLVTLRNGTLAVWGKNNGSGTTGAYTLHNNISLAGTSIAIDAGNGLTSVLAGTISGGTLTKTGAGTLRLYTTNTYSGGTTVSNGTLGVDSHATAGTQTPFGTGTVSVGAAGRVVLGSNAGSQNNAFVTIANNFLLSGGTLYEDDQKQVLTGNITIGSGGGILGATYNGAGADGNKGLYLNGVISGSDPITVQHSRLNINNNYDTSFVVFGNSGNTYSGTITVNENTTATEGGVYVGIGATNALQFATVVTAPIPGTALRFGISPIVFTTGLGSAAIGAISGAGNLVLTGYNTSTHAYGADAISLVVGGNGASTTYSGTISGIGNLTKSGSGAMTLSAANTFSGTTSVTAGTLVLTHGLALQNSVVAPSSGIVFDSSVAGNAFTFGGLTGSSNITLLDNASNAVNLSFGNTSADYGGSITAANAVTKVGAGTQTLSGSNSFAAGLNLNGGKLALASAGAIGGSGNLVFGGGALQYSAANTSDYSARIAAGTTSGTIAIDTNGQTVTFGTGFTATQTGGLTKSGSGSLVLADANSYSGTTAIQAGTLRFNAGSMSASSAVTISANSTLALASDSSTTFLPASAASQAGTIAINITAGGLSGGTGNTLTLGSSSVGLQLTGDNTVNVTTSDGYTLSIPLLLLGQVVNDTTIQTLNVASGSTLQVGTVTAANVNNRLAFSGAGDTVVTGPITQANANRGFGLVFNHTGTVTLSGTGTNLRNNTNAGSDKQVNLNSGTVNFNSNDAIRSTQGVTFNIAGGTVDNTSGSAVTLTRLGTTNINGDFAYAGSYDLDLGGNAFTLGSGTGTNRTITTNGSATLTIGGAIADGATGNRLTKAGAGVLQVAGAGTYTGGTSATGGTLRTNATGNLGTGTVAISGSGTTLELGNAASIADTASLVMESGTTLVLNFADASESVASVQFGSMVFDLPTVFTAENMHGVDSSYIEFAGSNASLTVVPEPASIAALGLGAAGLLTRRRRRRD